jgi:hypothetical protein
MGNEKLDAPKPDASHSLWRTDITMRGTSTVTSNSSQEVCLRQLWQNFLSELLEVYIDFVLP